MSWEHSALLGLPAIVFQLLTVSDQCLGSVLSRGKFSLTVSGGPGGMFLV